MYLTLYGSSLIVRCSGQNENPDDLNTGIPSVLKVRKMLFLLEKKPSHTCILYHHKCQNSHCYWKNAVTKSFQTFLYLVKDSNTIFDIFNCLIEDSR